MTTRPRQTVKVEPVVASCPACRDNIVTQSAVLAYKRDLCDDHLTLKDLADKAGRRKYGERWDR